MAGKISFGDEDDGGVMSDINVTPLVDVVLVLLIVFMITVPAVVGNAPVKVNLPETASFGGSTEELPMNIYVKREAGGGIVWYWNAEPMSIEQFQQKLRGVTKDQTVTISADKDIPYEEVVKVMDQLNKVGIHKIWLPTRHVAQ
jgi:biopolymer transport protein ExbD